MLKAEMKLSWADRLFFRESPEMELYLEDRLIFRESQKWNCLGQAA